ncbi:MAG: pyridoxamine 5'-phosphate oxidase [Actinomycetota bacterium]
MEDDVDRPLGEGDLDPDPIVQFGSWYREAWAAGLPRPDAMTLATATTEGVPSARMVLLKDFGPDGFVFYTNTESQKGRELQSNPRVALVFYWPELHRQVRIAGTVEGVSREDSEAYFATRPREARLAAWASRQSEVVAGRQGLEATFARLDAEYQGKEVPLPPFWGGMRVTPESIEFWQGRANRLHDRLRYVRQPEGGWRIERLSP